MLAECLQELKAICFRDLPVCKGKVYEENICHCHMDQCLESVRYSHIEKCGYTTLPIVVTTTEETIIDTNDTLNGNSSSTNSTSIDEILKSLTEEELHEIYAELFNIVSKLLKTSIKVLISYKGYFHGIPSISSSIYIQLKDHLPTCVYRSRLLSGISVL